jgi:hypothetical protein
VVRTFVVALVVALGACKAARDLADKAEKKYDERRAVEKEAERAAEDVAAKEEAERPPAPKPSGPGLASGKYRVREVRVAVMQTTRKGRAWDDAPGIEPDVVVRVRVDGKQVAKCETQESFAAHCKLDVEIELHGGSKLELDVTDRDSIVDDLIGKATLDSPSSWGTGIELPFQPTGRVTTASLTLGAPPTWWSLHSSRVLGLGAGIVFALLVIAAFRSSLMPPRHELPKETAV